MAKRDWSDHLNPVLVKEIRQYFHNRLILGVMGVLLGGQLLLLLFMQSDIRQHEVLETARGGDLFHWISWGVMGVVFLICGVGSLNRFTAERRDRELDFSRLTTLSPVRIVWGKFLSGIVMTVFLYALSLPFMVIAYFLRGISIFEMFLFTLLALPFPLIALQAGILFGTAGRNWLQSPYWIVMGGYGFLHISLVTLFLTNSGFYYYFLVGMLLLLLSMLLLFGLLFVLSVAATGHVTANRMLPVRSYLLACLLLSPGLGALLLPLRSMFGFGGDIRLYFLYPLLLFGLAIVAAVSTLAAFERESAGPRVLRNCPRNFWGRSGFFLLSSGFGGGLALSWLIVLLIIIPAGLIILYGNTSEELFFLSLLAAACYFLFYAEVALLLRKHFPVLPGWGWWLIVLTGLMVLPILLASATTVTGLTDNPSLLLLTTPFCMVDPDSSGIRSAVWIGPALASAFLLAGPGFRMIRQYRLFRRPEEPAAGPEAPENE